MAEKVTKYLGNFWKKICHQEFSKIVQSGHTGHERGAVVEFELENRSILVQFLRGI